MKKTDNQNQPVDARAMSRKSMEIPKVKRFYKDVTVLKFETGFSIHLDGRTIKTPGKAQALVPTRELAEMMGEEWRAQGKFIDPHAMPVTRLINTAIDAVAANIQGVVAEISGYGDADLICYRAEGPTDLIDLQSERWDEILDWAREELDAPFEVASGVMHIPQPEPSLEKIRQEIESYDVFALSALASLTNLFGSVLLALAVSNKRLDAAAAWAAAHVDEDWQARQWGEDSEAQKRRANRWVEMEAAARVARIGQ